MTNSEAIDCFEDDCAQCRQRKACQRLQKYGNSPCRNVNAISALRAQDADNEPLTLDELREMDGEPVFLVSYAYPQHTGWRIVRIDQMIDAATLWDNEGGYFDTRREYGKTWVAYRTKPELPEREGN